MQSGRAASRGWASTLLVVSWLAVLAVALIGTFANLGAEQWRTDEPVYRNAAVAIGEYDNFSHNLEHPPVAKYVMVVSMAVVGEGPVGARLPSALATIVAGVLLALLTARLVGGAWRGAAGWGALATFAVWTMLPHPDPAFDVTRLAYLDAPMAAFVAGALWAGWRWHERGAMRWAVATGVLAGLAVATKLPALAIAIALLALVAGPSWRTRVRGYALIAAVALVTFLATLAPLAGELPQALRYMLAMQARGGDSAGVNPFQQLVWQWQAWPGFALVQLVGVAAGLALLSRRAAWFIGLALAVPLLVFAVGSSRIHPHWQVAWQPALAVLVGAGFVRVVQVSRGRSWMLASLAAVGVVIAALVIVDAGVDRARASLDEPVTDIRRAGSLLASLDAPDAVFIDQSSSRVERSITHGIVANSAAYVSAAHNKHEWFDRAGGRPLQSRVVRPTDAIADRVVAVVRDGTTAPTFESPQLAALDLKSHRFGSLTVWVRTR